MGTCQSDGNGIRLFRSFSNWDAQALQVFAIFGALFSGSRVQNEADFAGNRTTPDVYAKGCLDWRFDISYSDAFWTLTISSDAELDDVCYEDRVFFLRKMERTKCK